MISYFVMARTFSKPIRNLLRAQSLIGLGNGIIAVLLNFYFKNIGLDEGIIGRLWAFQAFAAAASSIPMGWLADKTSRKKTYILGIVACAIGFGIVAFSRSLAIIVVACLISGIGLGAMMVSVQPFLLENSRRRQRPYLFSLNFSIILFMNIAAGILAGWLPGLFSTPGIIDPKSDPKALQTVLGIAAGFILLAIFPASRIKENRSFSADSPKQSVESQEYDLNAYRDAKQLIIKFMIPTALIGAGAGLIIPYFNLYFQDWVGAGIEQIGMVFAVGQLGTAVGGIVSPWTSSKLGLVKGVVLSEILSLPFMMLMAWSHDYWLCTICFVFRGALMNMNSPMRQEMLMATIPSNYRARASAADSMSWNLAWSASMLFSGNLIKNWGYDSCLRITCVLYMLSSVCYFAFFSKLEKEHRDKH